MVQKSTTNWDDIRLFLSLAEHGSARSAAAALGISHTTVARRVDQLEGDLGTRLFDRDVNGYRLTGAGETLRESARRAEDALLTAERRLQGRDDQLSGNIRLTVPDVIGTHLIMDELVTFAHRYPAIDLHLLTSYDVFDLARREADIAIRIIGNGRQPPEELIGRKLITIASCYYASSAYLQQHDPAVDGSGARWIGWNDEERFPDWVRQSPFPDVPARGNINEVTLQAEAARHGMGLAALPCFVGDATDGVVRIPGTEPYDNYDIWLLTHPDLRDAARFRSFRSFIVDVFDRKRALLRGAKSR